MSQVLILLSGIVGFVLGFGTWVLWIWFYSDDYIHIKKVKTCLNCEHFVSDVGRFGSCFKVTNGLNFNTSPERWWCHNFIKRGEG